MAEARAAAAAERAARRRRCRSRRCRPAKCVSPARGGGRAAAVDAARSPASPLPWDQTSDQLSDSRKLSAAAAAAAAAARNPTAADVFLNSLDDSGSLLSGDDGAAQPGKTRGRTAEFKAARSAGEGGLAVGALCRVGLRARPGQRPARRVARHGAPPPPPPPPPPPRPPSPTASAAPPPLALRRSSSALADDVRAAGADAAGRGRRRRRGGGVPVGGEDRRDAGARAPRRGGGERRDRRRAAGRARIPAGVPCCHGHRAPHAPDGRARRF